MKKQNLNSKRYMPLTEAKKYYYPSIDYMIIEDKQTMSKEARRNGKKQINNIKIAPKIGAI